MKRKKLSPKRVTLFLLLPLFLILSATIAFGFYQNHITFHMHFSLAQKPTITLTSAILNAYDNTIFLHVNETTKTIEKISPRYLLIQLNITNNGITPIERITINNTIPKNWTITHLSIQLLKSNQTLVTINPEHFTINYLSENHITVSTSNLRSKIGKTLNKNESIIVSIYLECTMKGQFLPPKYEGIPQNSTITAIATAWLGNLQSSSSTTILMIISYILLV